MRETIWILAILAVFALLAAVFSAVFSAVAQPAKPPTLEEILQRLQKNLDQYDSDVPSFFCDEHSVSRLVPDLHDRETVTDSVFRLKRVLNRDHTTTLEESREVKTVNGRPAKSQEIDGPSLLQGAFEGSLAVVSISQQACMNYTLERTKRNDPKAPIIVHFASVLTPENAAGCLLHEDGKGRVLIDPATMQISRMELTIPHHTIIPGGAYDSPIKGEWVLSVDYAPVVLKGETFWMPAMIASRATGSPGTFHATEWSFTATYRNYHKLEVTSRIVPQGDAPAP
jgi:hypothetical protein